MNAELSSGDVLYVETRHDSAGPILIVVGQFDMSGTEVFWAHVSQAVEIRPVSITVEARGLTFIDSSGLAAMVRAREAATDAGVTFRVSEPSSPLRRIAEICGLEGLLLSDGTPDAGPPPDPVGQGPVGDGHPESREPGDCPVWRLPETAQANRLGPRPRGDTLRGRRTQGRYRGRPCAAATRPRNPATSSPSCSRRWSRTGGGDDSRNILPTSGVYVVLDDGEARKVDLLRWGLVPGWAKDIKIGNRMINARAESVPTSGAYKSSFKRRRSILPGQVPQTPLTSCVQSTPCPGGYSEHWVAYGVSGR